MEDKYKFAIELIMQHYGYTWCNNCGRWTRDEGHYKLCRINL